MENKGIAMILLNKEAYRAPECEAVEVIYGSVVCASDGTERVNEDDGNW